LAYLGDGRLDALDRMLELVDDLQALPNPSNRQTSALPPFLSGGGFDVGWSRLPWRIEAEYRALAASLMAQYPKYLPPDLNVGGFTIRDAEKLHLELLARTAHAQLALMYGTQQAHIAAPVLERDDLIRILATATGVGTDRVLRLVDLLTFRDGAGADPCLTPLIPVGTDMLVPLSGLIFPSSPMRNLTALLQRQHSAFGAAGRHLGALGVETVRKTLLRLTRARVASSVKVIRPNGTQAGDLDIAVWDESTNELVVFEILWHIAPDGANEIARVEQIAINKRDQVLRLQSEMRNGAAAKWPADWPAVGNPNTRWYIMTPDVLAVQKVTDQGVTIRSHQLLARTLRAGSSLGDLITLLDDPPYPPPALSQAHWERVRYGDYQIEFEVVAA
jgi:hypothetical protein